MHTRSTWLWVVGCGLCLGLVGCESLQRKFTRKPKHAVPPPSPILGFQDYSRSMTPLDRYRKHYMMFDYWNSQLLEALQSPPLNPKRYQRASSDALVELETMRDLMLEETAVRMEPLIAARQRIHQQLQSPIFNASSSRPLIHLLETQTRQIHREFFWRDVEDHVKQ